MITIMITTVSTTVQIERSGRSLTAVGPTADTMITHGGMSMRSKSEARKARKFAHDMVQHLRFAAGDYRSNRERKAEYQAEPVLYFLECATEFDGGRYCDEFEVNAFKTPASLVQYLKSGCVVCIHGIYERVKA
jgi:hypothetical protein